MRPRALVSRFSVQGLFGIILLASAWTDLVEPQLLPGEYRLLSVDGVSPPVLRWATTGCDYIVSGATLTVGPADSVLLNVNEMYDCRRGGGPVTSGGRIYPGTFTLANRVLTLRMPPLGDAGPPLQLMGTLLGDGSVLDLDDHVDYAAGPGLLRLRR